MELSPSVNVNENITTGGPASYVFWRTLENQTTINNDWTTFRSNYSQRPFYIFQPKGTLRVSKTTFIIWYGLAYPVQLTGWIIPP